VTPLAWTMVPPVTVPPAATAIRSTGPVCQEVESDFDARWLTRQQPLMTRLR